MRWGFEVQGDYIKTKTMAKKIEVWSVKVGEDNAFKKATQKCGLTLELSTLEPYKSEANYFWYDISGLTKSECLHLGQKFMMEKVKQDLGLNEQ